MKRWTLCFGLLFGLAGQVSADVDTFQMGFYLPGIRDANLTDVRVSLQLWAEEVGAPYGLKTHAFIYERMAELHQDALNGKVDMVIAPGMELAETFTPEELTQGFTGYRNDTQEGLALVVAKRNRHKSFVDLRGKRLSRLEDDRLSDVFLETLCRKEAGNACVDVFQISRERRDILSIHKVFFGKSDAALVRLSALRAATELNPQIGAHLEALLVWKTNALSFGLMSSRVTSDFRELVLRSAQQASKTPRGKQILELFKTDYMGRADKQDLEPFWRLHREYQELVMTKSKRRQ